MIICVSYKPYIYTSRYLYYCLLQSIMGFGFGNNNWRDNYYNNLNIIIFALFTYTCTVYHNAAARLPLGNFHAVGGSP